MVVAGYAAVIGAVRCWRRKHGWRAALGLFLVFPAIHVSYGLGYLRGIWTFLILRRGAAPRQRARPSRAD